MKQPWNGSTLCANRWIRAIFSWSRVLSKQSKKAENRGSVINTTFVFYVFSEVRTNGKQGKCSHTCVFDKQFECEHTQNFCAVRRQKCLPKCLLGSLPEPSCLRRGADTPCLNFGTKCPKAEMLGNSFCCSPAGWKMWKVFSNIRAGHIIILPPQKPRLETLANRAFFRAKCSHISSAF